MTGSPTGVTSQSASRQRGLIPDIQGPRAAEFHARTLEALADIVAVAGFCHPEELEPHHLMHRIGSERALPMDRIHTFLPNGILLNAPEDTIYQDWWKATQANSFRPAIDLACVRAVSRLD